MKIRITATTKKPEDCPEIVFKEEESKHLKSKIGKESFQNKINNLKHINLIFKL